ncbi:hypothetical protein HK105_205255 [Polyrhizophydium stewartii]|uniref:Uncharacterized protein n=1 Tax=Polyrhizophydium stewartii TaxID=2732419 RepID=A0ABR4N6P5_9FUNG|nr:hypothetical protein HK105_007301 [Polyrhizophydium stewartii]
MHATVAALAAAAAVASVAAQAPVAVTTDLRPSCIDYSTPSSGLARLAHLRTLVQVPAEASTSCPVGVVDALTSSAPSSGALFFVYLHNGCTSTFFAPQCSSVSCNSALAFVEASAASPATDCGKGSIQTVQSLTTLMTPSSSGLLLAPYNFSEAPASRYLQAASYLGPAATCEVANAYSIEIWPIWDSCTPIAGKGVYVQSTYAPGSLTHKLCTSDTCTTGCVSQRVSSPLAAATSTCSSLSGSTARFMKLLGVFNASQVVAPLPTAVGISIGSGSFTLPPGIITATSGPKLSSPTSSPKDSQSSASTASSSNVGLYVGIAAGVVVLLGSVIGFALFKRNRQAKGVVLLSPEHAASAAPDASKPLPPSQLPATSATFAYPPSAAESSGFAPGSVYSQAPAVPAPAAAAAAAAATTAYAAPAPMFAAPSLGGSAIARDSGPAGELDPAEISASVNNSVPGTSEYFASGASERHRPVHRPTSGSYN